MKPDSSTEKSRIKLNVLLAKKIESGCSHSCEQFVKLNYSWLLFVVKRQFKKPDNHKEIVQNTFMTVLANLKKGRVKDCSRIVQHLKQTAYQLGIEYLRKEKKLQLTIDKDHLNYIENANNSNIYSVVEQLDSSRYVNQLIEEMGTQRDIDILMKYYIQKQSRKAICIELNLTEADYRKVISGAKQKLKLLIATKGDTSNVKMAQM